MSRTPITVSVTVCAVLRLYSGLLTSQNVGESLSRLSRNGILTVKREGQRSWRIGWGQRARTIAEKAGVKTLPL